MSEGTNINSPHEAKIGFTLGIADMPEYVLSGDTRPWLEEQFNSAKPATLFQVAIHLRLENEAGLESMGDGLTFSERRWRTILGQGGPVLSPPQGYTDWEKAYTAWASQKLLNDPVLRNPFRVVVNAIKESGISQLAVMNGYLDILATAEELKRLESQKEAQPFIRDVRIYAVLGRRDPMEDIHADRIHRNWNAALGL